MKSLGIFIFSGVQTLDLFGPIEMLGAFPEDIELALIAETRCPVLTRHGQHIIPDATIQDGDQYDLLLIPGGDSAIEAGRRSEVIDWIGRVSDHAEVVMTVCTGSILLAMAGRLDERKATTNKQDFVKTTPLGPLVNWVPRARWVQDGKFFTSSGVSTGIDMSLAAIAHLMGQDKAQWLADGCEYDWHSDPDWDPFAAKCGLVMQ